MKDIMNDLNNLHWWFNILVGIIIIAIGYVITEFIIKPIGIRIKGQVGGQRKTKTGEAKNHTDIVNLIKEDERAEMRMHFDYASIQRAITFRLYIIVLNILAIACYFFIDSTPIKISLIGFALWSLFSITRQLIKLIHYQDYLSDILERVKKD